MRPPFALPGEEHDDEALERIDQLFKRCIEQHQSAYPESSIDFNEFDLTMRISQIRVLIGRGHFADVYQGILDEEAKQVAIKVLRLPMYTPQQNHAYESMLLRFFRELNYWSQLQHLNVARMLGFTSTGGSIGFVSHWYPNGNLPEYIKANPDASKANLILDTAEGLCYLHTVPLPLIHADLKGVNIFINENGVACLGDFGISKQLNDLERVTGFTTSSLVNGTMPWMAPELFGDVVSFTLASDVYALAGVFLETMCPGKYPFHYILNDITVIMSKLRGNIPDLEQYPEMQSQHTLWELMTKCWERDSSERPKIQDIVHILYDIFGLRPRVVQSIVTRPLRIQAERASSAEPGTSPWGNQMSQLVSELVLVEERQLGILDQVVSKFVDPLRQYSALDAPTSAMQCFAESILDITTKFREPGEKFLRSLYDCCHQQHEDSRSTGANLLKGIEDFLPIFQEYLESIPTVQEEFGAMVGCDPAFTLFLTDTKLDLNTYKSGMFDMLRFPSDRLPAYKTLLAAFTSETSPSFEGAEELKQGVLLLSKEVDLAKIRDWQTFMDPEPREYSKWRTIIDQKVHLDLMPPTAEMVTQSWIYEMIRMEMEYVRTFKNIEMHYIHPLEHSIPPIIKFDRSRSQPFIKATFGGLLDIFEEHRKFLSQLHEIQRDNYPSVPLKPIINALLEYVSSRKDKLVDYAQSYPASLHRMEHELSTNHRFRAFDERCAKELQFLKTDDNAVNFTGLVFPILQSYTDSLLPGLERNVTLEPEDHTLILRATQVLGELVSELEPLLLASKKKADLLRFTACLQFTSTPSQRDLDILNGNHEIIYAEELWATRTESRFLVLLDDSLLITAVKSADKGRRKYKCLRVIPLVRLITENWYHPPEQWKWDGGSVDCYPFTVMERSATESLALESSFMTCKVSFRLLAESERSRLCWKQRLEGAISASQGK